MVKYFLMVCSKLNLFAPFMMVKAVGGLMGRWVGYLVVRLLGCSVVRLVGWSVD